MPDENVKAFAVGQHAAVIGVKPQHMGAQPTLNVLSSASTGVFITGEAAIREVISACQFALGEGKGAW